LVLALAQPLTEPLLQPLPRSAHCGGVVLLRLPPLAAVRMLLDSIGWKKGYRYLRFVAFVICTAPIAEFRVLGALPHTIVLSHTATTFEGSLEFTWAHWVALSN